jgi:hypothetical protein
MPKYFLKAAWEEDFRKVTEEQFIAAEREAGFHSKFGENTVATAGFNSNGVCGKVEYDTQTDAKPATKEA